MTLTDSQLAQFLEDGFVRVDDAFPRSLADSGRAILWRDTGCAPDDPTTWNRPVIRLGGYSAPPFVEAANTRRLTDAYDQLVGVKGWIAPPGLGTFPVRFPHPADPGDAGWHIDTSFRTDDDDPADFFGWRVNLQSRGRALLMLFLFSDVSEEDAPSLIRRGSHLDVARRLASTGERGLTLRELAAEGFESSASRPVTSALGPAGTVYLCHPFLVHSAQRHRGTEPRFMAQPPLFPARPFDIAAGDSPIERAIRSATIR